MLSFIVRNHESHIIRPDNTQVFFEVSNIFQKFSCVNFPRNAVFQFGRVQYLNKCFKQILVEYNKSILYLDSSQFFFERTFFAKVIRQLSSRHALFPRLLSLVIFYFVRILIGSQ